MLGITRLDNNTEIDLIAQHAIEQSLFIFKKNLPHKLRLQRKYFLLLTPQRPTIVFALPRVSGTLREFSPFSPRREHTVEPFLNGIARTSARQVFLQLMI